METELVIRSKGGLLAEGRSVSVGGVLKELHVTSVSGIFDPEESQAYYWTEEWQAGEREADEDIAAGRVRTFDNPADAIKFLEDL